MNTTKPTLNVIYTKHSENISELNFDECETKNLALTVYKKYVMEKIVDIKSYKQFEDETAEVNIFSIMMDVPPQFLTPVIRVCLAFVEEDENVIQILDFLKWSEDPKCSLKGIASMRQRIMDNLMKICNNPEKYLSQYKLDLIKKYLEKNEEHFGAFFWKMNTFKILTLMYKIVLAGIKFMDCLNESFSDCSLSIEVKEENCDRLLADFNVRAYKPTNNCRTPSKSPSKKTRSMNHINKSRSRSRKTISFFKPGEEPHYLTATASTSAKTVKSKVVKSMNALPDTEPLTPKKKIPKKRASEPINRLDTLTLEKYRTCSLKCFEECNKLINSYDEEIKKN